MPTHKQFMDKTTQPLFANKRDNVQFAAEALDGVVVEAAPFDGAHDPGLGAEAVAAG